MAARWWMIDWSCSAQPTGPAIDVVAFLWASLGLFDDEELPDTAVIYRPAPLVLHTVAPTDAAARGHSLTER
jgi:hypothetical protein